MYFLTKQKFIKRMPVKVKFILDFEQIKISFLLKIKLYAYLPIPNCSQPANRAY